MASGPSTSWQIDRETVETASDFIFLGSKITADGDCSHEIKTLTPWKESYYQPRQHIKKQRHYFANKGLSNQSYGFSVVIYGCESWTIKKAAAATAADKSLQLCTTLCDPIDGSPPGSSSQRKLSSD